MRSLNASGAIDQYDRFIVTRSDYMHKMLHAPLSVLPPEYIWIPDGERYNGVTVRGFPLQQLLPAKWGSLRLCLGTVCALKAGRHVPGMQPYHCLQWAALRRRQRFIVQASKPGSHGLPCAAVALVLLQLRSDSPHQPKHRIGTSSCPGATWRLPSTS